MVNMFCILGIALELLVPRLGHGYRLCFPLLLRAGGRTQLKAALQKGMGLKRIYVRGLLLCLRIGPTGFKISFLLLWYVIVSIGCLLGQI